MLVCTKISSLNICYKNVQQLSQCSKFISPKSTFTLQSNNVMQRIYPIQRANSQRLSCPDQSFSVENNKLSSETWSVMYKYPTIKYIRLISRFKVYQILIMCGLCYPLYGWYMENLISRTAFISAIGGCAGTSVVFLIFSYFSTKVVGQMYINNTETAIRLSTLNFYGSRIEITYECSHLIPWSDESSEENLKNIFQRLYIEDKNGKRWNYIYSLRHGKLYNKELFCNVLGIPLDR